MDKKNLKRAALLGLVIGAAAVSAPANAYEPVISQQGMMLAKGCGAHCGGSKGGNIADADEPTLQNQPGTYHSCSGNTMPQNGRQWPQASCSNRSAPQGSCSGRSSCNGNAPKGY